jgi:hypothetical protein
MKNFAALLAAVAFITPVVAQNDVVKELQKKQKIATVAPAVKPILLHTGKPITQNDKQQLLASVVKAYAAKAQGGKSKRNAKGAASSATTSVLLTPKKMSKADFVYTFADNVAYLGYSDVGEVFQMGASSGGTLSDLSFVLLVNPNTAYTLTFTVAGNGAGTGNGTFKIVDGHYPEQTVTGVKNESTEFAYAFISDSSGTDIVSVTSSQPWSFTSCEIVANPIK